MHGTLRVNSKLWFLIVFGSNPKRFSLFVFDFNLSNKVSSTPTRLLNFQEFSNSPFYKALKRSYFGIRKIQTDIYLPHEQ